MCCALLSWWSCLAFAQAVDPLPFADRAEEVRFQNLAHELRCVQCQNNSLADSDGMIARDVRHEVFRLMREGMTDDQIKNFLVERYGDFVLFKPRVEPLTYVLWFGPALLLLVGAIGGIIMFRRRVAVQSQTHDIQSQEER
jgi:cytochrome c-type biogenesis protein CcmH